MSNLVDNNVQKEEILARIRELQQDEGIEYAVNKGAMLGNYYTGGAGVALIAFSIFTGQMLVVYAVLALYGAFCFGEFLAKYWHLKQKRYMIGAVLFGVIFGGFFAFLFVRDVGVLHGWW